MEPNGAYIKQCVVFNLELVSHVHHTDPHFPPFIHRTPFCKVFNRGVWFGWYDHTLFEGVTRAAQVCVVGLSQTMDFHQMQLLVRPPQARMTGFDTINFGLVAPFSEKHISEVLIQHSVGSWHIRSRHGNFIYVHILNCDKYNLAVGCAYVAQATKL